MNRLGADSVFTGDYAHDFKIWAEYYDSQPELEILSDHVDLTGSKVFEAGCGSGRLSFRVASDEYSITSVDIVPSLIQLCHTYLQTEFEGDRSQLRFEVQNLEALPYPDNHFSHILEGWTFTTIDDTDAAAEEYKRILTEDGAILAFEVRAGSPYQEILEQFVPEDAYDDDQPEPDVLMEQAFGSPDYTEDIVSEYWFESVDEAFDAFWFNFTEWMRLELTDGQADALKDEIRRYQTEDGVVIDEYAKFYKFDTPS